VKKTSDELKKDLSAIIDPAVAKVLIDSYAEMQQRYYAGDWKPSELDGGQFCEAAARAIYEIDTGATTPLGVGDICNLLRAKKGTPPPAHQLQEKDREHFCRILQAVYNLRNDRGIAHISVTDGHTANQMDAALIVGAVKWLFGEFLRLAQKLDRKEVVAITESIIQLEHPLIHELDGKPQVMHIGLSIGEEILLLLQHSPQGRATKDQLRTWIPKSTISSMAMAVMRLQDARQVRPTDSGEIAITPPGQKRLQQEILPKVSAVESSTPAKAPTRRGTATRRKPGSRATKAVARTVAAN
jgi:hypothetical protein